MDEAKELDVFIGRRLRELRKARRMSMQTLGSMTGVVQQQCHRYEKGMSRVSASQLWRFSRALGVPMYSFFPDADLPDKNPAVAAQIARIPPLIRTAISELIEVVTSAKTSAPAPASPPPSSSA